ncbi:MAG: response regulator [Chloroflexota bacterium]|nr:response regulator [Chloroflexota bacterium]
MTHPHILYIKDDPSSGDVMRMLIESSIGANLTIFTDRIDFMARLRALIPPPTLILLDIQMLRADDFKLVADLRADANAAPLTIIALTDSLMCAEVQRLRHAGFDGALAKTLNIKTFPALMTVLLNHESSWHLA